jgi:hypothetical protein
MKTSKIIFVSLLGMIALVILAGFIGVRLNVTRSAIDLIVKKDLMPEFKVLYIKNCDVQLSYDDSSSIVLSAYKEIPLSEINYNFKNDTLTMSDIRYSYESKVRVKIHSSDSLKNILAVNSDLSIESYGSKNLSIQSDRSNVSLTREENEQFTFHSLNIFAKNHSRISSGELKVETLKIFLEKSEANLEIAALSLNGNLSDSSTIYTHQSAEISLKKDETSRIIVNW